MIRAAPEGLPDPAHPPEPGRIRVATLDDLDGILALEHRCFGPADRFSRSTWRHLLGPAARALSSLTLVISSGDLVVAKINALLRTNSRILRIYSIGVDPSQRGRGLARLLLLAALRRAPERCDTVSLEVRSANAAARRLYENLGMHIHEELPGHYPDGGDGLRYRAPATALRAALRTGSGRAPASGSPRTKRAHASGPAGSARPARR